MPEKTLASRSGKTDVGVIPYVLDFRREATFYFSRHLYLRDLDDLNFIFELANSITPPDNGCYIIVPMHARENLLQQYLRLISPQLLGTKATVILFINAATSQCSEVYFHQQINSARACINNNPAASRITLTTRLFNSSVTMGRLRGLLADSAVINAYQNKIEHPIIISNDVDALQISDDYVETFAQKFAADKNLKLSAGMVEYGYRGEIPTGALKKHPVPELYIFNELNKSINLCAREGFINYERRIWIEGANAAFSGAAYCAAGGFDYEIKSGEDDALGRALNRLNPNSFASKPMIESTLYATDPILRSSFEPECWVLTNPRRVLAAISSGLPGIEAWADLPFMDTIGAAMSAENLAARCANHPMLITSTRLIAAAKGSSQARGFVVSRLRSLLARSIIYDRKAQTVDQVSQVLSSMGIRARSPHTVQWGDGEFFERLCSTVTSCQ